jgi:putative Mg2+ transporter-C (MgtC) family protein
MQFDYAFFYDNSIKLLVSLALGALIGAEREYKGRNIGFRTILLITLGSTFFTILSYVISNGGDHTRVASNIVTGVGFLGAGAIFRDGATVRGVTTASIIWISAAIGMACGIGQYEFAVMVTITVLIILLGFAWMQKFIDRYNRELVYRITISNNLDFKHEIEKNMKGCKLRFDWLSHTKINEDLVIEYEVRGSDASHNALLHYLTINKDIKSFHV